MRRILLDITKGYDVMIKCTSIAGVAMSVYKRLFLKENLVAIVPDRGYERNDRASDRAIKYLEWIASKEKLDIQHAGNGREFVIGPFKVDGYIASQRRVIEFLGCHFHSHPPCCDADAMAPNGTRNRVNYAQTMKRIDEIRANGGYIVDYGIHVINVHI
jgi:hypothetical protein